MRKVAPRTRRRLVSKLSSLRLVGLRLVKEKEDFGAGGSTMGVVPAGTNG